MKSASVINKGKKLQLFFISALIAVVITYIAVQGLIPVLAQYGFFNSWNTITSPPSGIKKIVGIVGGSETHSIWVETNAGKAFTISVCGEYFQTCDQPQWQIMPAAPANSNYVDWGMDCKNLGSLPLNPKGPVVECAHYSFVNLDAPTEIYAALMADGSLEYFVMDFNILLIEGKIILAVLLLYMVVFCLAFYSVRYFSANILGINVRW